MKSLLRYITHNKIEFNKVKETAEKVHRLTKLDFNNLRYKY